MRFAPRARSQGFIERELHVVERGFDWQGLIADSRSMSLFAERKIIEIRMTNPTPGEQGADAIVELAEQPSPDNAGADHHRQARRPHAEARAGSAQSRSTACWCRSGRSICRACRHGFASDWRRHKLQADAAAAALLAERVEGNLLAAHQEIEKLALLLPPGPVTAETVVDAVADSARFDVLQLGEAAMRGQTARALRILEGLRGEDVEPTLVLWAVNKDLQWIARAQQPDAQGPERRVAR